MRERRHRSLGRLAALACLAAVALACSAGTDVGTVAPASAPDGTPAALRSIEDSRAPELPPHGSVTLYASERGYTVLANRARLRRVVRELERAALVHVEVAEMSSFRGTVTLRLVDAPLEHVLAELFPGVGFALHFSPDPEGPGTLLAGISVGEPAPPDVALAPAASRRERRAGRREPRVVPTLTPEEIERRREERVARLADPDPYVRAREAAWIDPDSEEGLDRIRDILGSDPASEVRVAATEALADGDSYGAVGALLGALEDPDPAVVVAALEALEFAGDETIIPRLEPALEHPSAEVRERALEAIEFLAP